MQISFIPHFKQTELILLQLLHQKPHFSACGLFRIDMTFVYAVKEDKWEFFFLQN